MYILYKYIYWCTKWDQPVHSKYNRLPADLYMYSVKLTLGILFTGEFIYRYILKI